MESGQFMPSPAVVNWLRLSEQDFGFGSPLSVWYARNFEDVNMTEFQDGVFAAAFHALRVPDVTTG